MTQSRMMTHNDWLMLELVISDDVIYPINMTFLYFISSTLNCAKIGYNVIRSSDWMANHSGLF
jgi:hypothetical protein